MSKRGPPSPVGSSKRFRPAACLPDEIGTRIMRFLSDRLDILNASLVCHKFLEWCRDAKERCIVCKQRSHPWSDVAYISLRCEVEAHIKDRQVHFPWELNGAAPPEGSTIGMVSYAFNMGKLARLEEVKRTKHVLGLHVERRVSHLLRSEYTNKARSVRCHVHEGCERALKEWNSTLDAFLDASGESPLPIEMRRIVRLARRLYDIESNDLLPLHKPIVPLTLLENDRLRSQLVVRCWLCSRWLAHGDEYNAYIRRCDASTFVRCDFKNTIHMPFREDCQPSKFMRLVGVCYVHCVNCPPRSPSKSSSSQHQLGPFFDETDSWAKANPRTSYLLPSMICTKLPAIRDKLVFCYTLQQ